MIALDTAINGGLTNPGLNRTWSHTCTGSNLILWVAAFGDIGNDVITGATYNAVAMTLANKSQIPSDRWVYLFYLIAPATGAHNVIVTSSASVAIGGDSASYTGASQVNQPDAVVVASNTTATTSTTTLTTIAANCWTVMAYKTTGAGGTTDGTGSTTRASGNDLRIVDSNGPINPSGSYSMGMNNGASDTSAAVMASFIPANAAGPSRFMSFFE